MDSAQTLHDFVLNLLSNPDARMAFQVDPDGALHDAGLDDVNAQDVQDAIPLVVDSAPAQQLAGLGSDTTTLHGDAMRADMSGAIQQLQLVTQQVPVAQSAADFTMAASGGLAAAGGPSGYANIDGGAWSSPAGGSFGGALGLSPGHDTGTLDVGGSAHPADLTSLTTGALSDPTGTLSDPTGVLGHAGTLLGADPSGALGLDPTATLNGVAGTATHGLTGYGTLLDGHALDSTGLGDLTGHGLDLGGLTGGPDLGGVTSGLGGGLGGGVSSGASLSGTPDSTHVSLGGDGVLNHGPLGGVLGQVAPPDATASTDDGHLLGIPLF
jgi:hypothetical protein